MPDIAAGIPQQERTPFHMVGMEEDDPKPVLHRGWVLCDIFTPVHRSITKSMPLEEIPLLRKVCSKMGGKLTIIGGLQHTSYAQYLIQPLNMRQAKSICAGHQATYNGRQIANEVHDIFDDVYGKGENCTIIDKMKMISDLYCQRLPKPISTKDPTPELVEGIIKEVFPHLSSEQAIDTIDIPGLESLRSETEAAPLPDVVVGVDQAVVDADETSIGLVSKAGKNVELIAFMQSPQQTDRNPLNLEQAESVAELLAKKPIEEWEKEDWSDLPGLDVRSKQRIERVLRRFYAPEGDE